MSRSIRASDLVKITASDMAPQYYVIQGINRTPSELQIVIMNVETMESETITITRKKTSLVGSVGPHTIEYVAAEKIGTSSLIRDAREFEIPFDSIMGRHSDDEIIAYLNWLNEKGLINFRSSYNLHVETIQRMNERIQQWIDASGLPDPSTAGSDEDWLDKMLGEGPVEMFDFVNRHERHYVLHGSDVYGMIIKEAIRHRNGEVILRILQGGHLDMEFRPNVDIMSLDDLTFYNGILRQVDPDYAEVSREVEGEIVRKDQQPAVPHLINFSSLSPVVGRMTKSAGKR